MLKGFSVRLLRDRRMIRFGRRWNTTHVASEVPAAHHGHTETVRNVAGLPEVDVKHADENGMTALHWEAKRGCPDVQALVDAGQTSRQGTAWVVRLCLWLARTVMWQR